VVRVSSYEHAILKHENGEKLLLVIFDGENYHDRYISLVKSAKFISKTGHRFCCLNIVAILFTLLAVKCQGECCLTSAALHWIFDIRCAN